MPEEGGGDVELVWAQLQCHRVMDELRTAGFGAHPALSHVLNLHIQDNVVSRSKFEALERKFIEVERITKEARKAADKPRAAGGTPRGPAGSAGGAKGLEVLVRNRSRNGGVWVQGSALSGWLMGWRIGW
jgi:hypothetical protein